MLLSDPRLDFATELIRHWLDIRGSALVPLEEDLVPSVLRHCFDHVAIADLTRPAQVILDIAGAGLSRRFGREVARANWVDLVPPALGDVGLLARDSVCGVPCGFYHEITARPAGASAGTAGTAETLVLPLRHLDLAVPHAVIGIAHEDSDTPFGWLAPSARIERHFYEFVDIGAGVGTEG